MRKNTIRSSLSFIMVLLLCFLSFSAAAAPSDYNRNMPETLTADQLYGNAAVVLDASTGNVLLDKNADVRMYPASTTKMMTLLLACESGWSMDMQITIPAEAGNVPSDSSMIPVYPGETMTFGDLLYGMMLHSGNDGANAIAVLVGGSISNFVSMMNNRAAQIGCTGTHFVNAHGYHDENHYTTAMDLARIAQTAMQNETFRQISMTYSKTINITGADGMREIELKNKNVMLNPASDYFLDGCVGIKTGSHTAAGQCFVGAIDKDDILLITVTLKCTEETEKWIDTMRMTRYAHTQYESYTLEKLFEMVAPRIKTTIAANAKSDDPNGGAIQFKLSEISDPIFTRKIQKDSPQAFSAALEDFSNRIEIHLSGTPVAPITEGEAIGTFSYRKQNGEIITATLVAGNSIAAQPVSPRIFDVFPFLHIFDSLIARLLFIVLVLLVIVAILLVRAQKKREEKRRREAYRRRKAQAAKRRAAAARNGSVRTTGTQGKPRSGAATRKTAVNTKKRVQKSNDDDLFNTFD